SIREDLSWLECPPVGEVTQSTRLDIYYQYVEDLLKKGKAYVCTCNPENFRKCVTSSAACPCRDLSTEASLDRWGRMLDGDYAEGAAVVRVKADLTHPNPAVRDWPALRIVDVEKSPHPLVGAKCRVWPLYNFSAGIDDHLMGISHIIRGKEHLTNEVRQRFLYAHLGWDYPDAIHYGRLKIAGAELSKSKIKLGVEQGLYSNYDDLRLPTFSALRRRGITPQAIRRMMIDVGINPNDVTLSLETLYTYNRRIIDPTAKRFFFISNPITLRIRSVEKPYAATPNLHPGHPEWGKRRIELTPKDGYAEVLISREDLSLASPNTLLRLMGLFNIKVIKASEDHVEAVYHSESYEEAKRENARLIQFLPAQAGLPASVRMPTGEVLSGLAEDQCRELRVDEIIQFERFGFVKVETVHGQIVACFAHK
ncbi:MAG: glutamate--tRNA ligase, partial [Candidatus Bathyarchaeia archaeon]